MNKKREGIFLAVFLFFTTFFLTAGCYYSGARYVGDTATYAQVTKNIAYTGKGESDMWSNGISIIERHIWAIPVAELLDSEIAFEDTADPRKNMMGYHACFILYLIAPLCYVMSEFACITIAQSLALALSLFFCILLMREKEVPWLLIIITCILLTAHPGWSMPAVSGAFYPERIFMGTGMYLIWACEKKQFSKLHFIVATILCMMVGERGALYAGMFILAYTIFFWKERPQLRGMRLALGSAAVLYTGIMMKFFLANMYYSGLGSLFNINSIVLYLSDPDNMRKVILFIIINFCFYLVVAFMDWKALIIGMASTVPNLLYNVGGAEKIGWGLHYHVFYFVFLMWAVTRGMIKLYDVSKRWQKIKLIPYAVSLTVAFLISIVDPYDLSIRFNISNLNNNVVVCVRNNIRRDYFEGGAEKRREFRQFINENIPSNSKVSSIEGAYCELETIPDIHAYLYPAGIKCADFAVVNYQNAEEGYDFEGAIVYANAEDVEIYNRGVVEKMREYGFDIDNPILFPSYSNGGVAILKRK